MNILVADDSDEVRSSLARWLEVVRDADVTQFVYPDQAMKAIEDGYRPDGVVTDYDYGIGHRNGVQFIRDLRAAGITCAIALLTGSAIEPLKEELKNERLVEVYQKGGPGSVKRMGYFLMGPETERP